MDELFIEVSDSSFDYEVLGLKKPAIVYFSLPWSLESRQNMEMLEDLVFKYSDKVKFYTVNIEKNPHIVSRFEINSKPTLLILKYGLVVGRYSEEIDPVDLGSFLDELISKPKKIEEMSASNGLLESVESQLAKPIKPIKEEKKSVKKKKSALKVKKNDLKKEKEETKKPTIKAKKKIIKPKTHIRKTNNKKGKKNVK